MAVEVAGASHGDRWVNRHESGGGWVIDNNGMLHVTPAGNSGRYIASYQSDVWVNVQEVEDQRD